MATRVLVIEDNPANLELMRFLLTAHGYAVLAAHDGEEGLDIARRELPDLILCDLQMPGIDGYQVARQVKGTPSLQHIPIVAVTAYAMVGDRDKVLSAGFDGYFAKPIAPETFVQKVEAFLKPEFKSQSLPPAAAATSPWSKPPGLKSHTALVVDDLQAHLDLAASVLGHSGFKVVTARGIREGLEQARRVTPDLILSDVCMADGSGYEFIGAIKNDPQLRSIPFIFLTSTAMNEKDRAKGLALGAAKYLFRPIEPQTLLDEIKACL
jgi:two-component system, cell cycle response regulator